MRNKVTACLGGLLALSLGWLSWRHASPLQPHNPGPRLAIRSSVPYALALANNEVSFDLEFGSNDTYRLLISNFGTVDETAQVSLQATPVSAVESFSGERIGLLPVRPLKNASANAASNPIPEGVQTAAVPDDFVAGIEKIIPTGHSVSPGERDFFLHVTDGALENPKAYVRVRSTVLTEGPQCRVYLDLQQPRTAAIVELGSELLRVFQDEVLPKSRATIGTHRDVDGDGKLALLLTPWLGKLQGGETTLKGFTRSSDFGMGIPSPFSNQCDVIYLHSQLRPGPVLRDLLAHEYAHAVSFSIRQGATPGAPNLPEEEDWLNEGVAHLAENLAGSGWTNLDYRISRFLDDPSRSPLIVSDYYRSGLWRDHGCRGATYLFLRWCTDVWGDQLPAALLRSPTSGIANLERCTGLSFPQLYRHFNLALASEGDLPASGTVAADAVKSIRPLETVSLFSRLGNWQLAGPRWDVMPVVESVNPAKKELTLRGTSTAFVELRGSAAAETVARRIHLRGSAGSRLQVTLIRCRPDSPKLNLSAAWEVATESRDDPRASGVILATASESSLPLQIESVVLEQNFDETRRSLAAQLTGETASTGQHVMSMVARTGKEPVGAATRPLRVTVPRESLVGISGPWQVKVVARDPLGRRVSTIVPLPEWHEAVPATAGTAPPALR